MQRLRSIYRRPRLDVAAGGHRATGAVRGIPNPLGEGAALRFERADSARLAVVVAATVVALPLLFKETRNSQQERPSPIAAVNVGGDPGAPLRTNDGAAADDSASTAAPDPVPSSSSTSEIVIAVPTTTPAGQNNTVGKATYQALTGSSLWARPCTFPGAPVNSTVRVMNLDNGKLTSCTVVSNRPPANGMTIVLDSNVFRDVADLLEAPIPVRVIWNG